MGPGFDKRDRITINHSGDMDWSSLIGIPPFRMGGVLFVDQGKSSISYKPGGVLFELGWCRLFRPQIAVAHFNRFKNAYNKYYLRPTGRGTSTPRSEINVMNRKMLGFHNNRGHCVAIVFITSFCISNSFLWISTLFSNRFVLLCSRAKNILNEEVFEIKLKCQNHWNIT